MKLRQVRIREFKSVWDTGTFHVGQVTCLVGKNEAGKTTILDALHRLNPIEGTSRFDVTHDYPRTEVEDYRHDVESGRRRPAEVVEATFELEQEELTQVAAVYGRNALQRPEVVLSKYYPKEKGGDCRLWYHLPVDERAVVAHLVDDFELPEELAKQARASNDVAQLHALLTEHAKEQEQAATAARAHAKTIETEAEKAEALKAVGAITEAAGAKALRTRLGEMTQTKNLATHIWTTILRPLCPKFLYFDEYYQMTGADNVEALKDRKSNNQLRPPDYPLLGLIELARLDLDKLLTTQSTQELKNNLEGASNHLTRQVLKYWSQNKHLRMNFDVRQALPEDPEGMRTGRNIWGEVYDQKHLASTGLGTRSRGFVWFFSFLAWYSAEKRKDEPLVLLLDEPGLSLHGKAQGDLLRYFEAEVASNPKHQLIYTTHSPFMVDPVHFDRVRIVQDRGIDADEELPRGEDGTKVLTDVLEAGPDSLFPLQGALGYEIHQTLFVGPNCLIVEGVSDLLYIQTLSGVLEQKGRTGLDERWTITPVGGANKVPTFVALIGSQKNLNLATLIDLQKSDQQMIENLYKKKLLEKAAVKTFADFTSTPEADIEDMFDEVFYLQLVNGEFTSSLSSEVKAKDLTSNAPRMLVRLDEYWTRKPMKGGIKFSHYRPARFLTENVASLIVPDATLDRFEAAFEAVNALLRN